MAGTGGARKEGRHLQAVLSVYQRQKRFGCGCSAFSAVNYKHMPDRSRILVVDDETQITRVLKTTLSSQGYEVKTATDGEDGFNCAMDWLPDLIVTDLSMPRMSGIELCRAVRERSHVPIIVLSVRGEEKNKIEALDAGADDYVTKPFSTHELLARIRAHLRRVGAGKQYISDL